MSAITENSFDSQIAKNLWKASAQLQGSVQRLIQAHGRLTESFDADVRDLAKSQGNAAYSEVFFHLSRLVLDPSEAKAHWDRIVQLRNTASARCGFRIDFRAMLVQYFSELDLHLKNPVVIDLSVFELMQESLLKDELTDLHNYRFLVTQLEHELRRAEQGGLTLSLAMIDLDHFKIYNDKHGHEAGNQVLVDLSRLLKNGISETDSAVRYGGEEFVVLMPATSKEGAARVAERLFSTLEKTAFAHGATQPLGRITVSLGIATYPGDATNARQLLERADAAMYVAKTKGRNQIHLYGHNRRSHTRIEASLDGVLAMAAVDSGTRFKTKDISEGGMLIETDREVLSGTLLDLRVDLQDGSTPFQCAARVTRCVRQGEAMYDVGVHFLYPNAEEHRRVSHFIRRRADQAGASSHPVP